MFVRTALLVLSAMLISAAHAEELQVSITGKACVLSNQCSVALFNGGSTASVTISPFSITYLLNTATAQLQNPVFASSVLQYFDATFPVTNYKETLGGQTTFAPVGSGIFEFLNPGPMLNGTYQMFGSAGGSCPTCGGFGFDHSVTLPLTTQAQYMSFDDPLASMLFTYTPEFMGGTASSNGYILDGTLTVKPVAVPTPPTMLLLLTGLLAILAERSRHRVLPRLSLSRRGSPEMLADLRDGA